MKQGLAIHCHHDVLIEYCYDYDERVNVIKRYKSQNEQEIRLRLFKLLPQEAINELPDRLVKACQKWEKAHQKWIKADQKWRKVDPKWWKAEQKWWKAYYEWRKVDQEWIKACQKWNKANRETWHKKWCGCKEWNGKEVVFKAK